MKIFPHFPKISYTVIIICFMLPFMVVKCNNVEIANLNGFQLVAGTEIQAEKGSAEVVEPNLFVAGALLAAALGLVFAFLTFKGSKIVSLIISVIGIAFLLLFYFDVQENVPSTTKGIIIISLGTGYYLSLIGFLINAVFFGYRLGQKDKEVIEVLPNEPINPSV